MSFALQILLFEMLIMILCVVSILLVRIFEHVNDARHEKLTRKLKDLIKEAMEKDQKIDLDQIPSPFSKVGLLLPVLEFFEQNFKDPAWDLVKSPIVKHFLEPQIPKLLEKRNWQKRQLGLRSIALDAPNLLLENKVVALLGDPVYLVRVAAAQCLIKSDQPKFILPIIERMNRETPMARYPYRDLLMHGGREVFAQLEEITKVQTDPAIISVCTDVLSTKVHRPLTNPAGYIW